MDTTRTAFETSCDTDPRGARAAAIGAVSMAIFVVALASLLAAAPTAPTAGPAIARPMGAHEWVHAAHDLSSRPARPRFARLAPERRSDDASAAGSVASLPATPCAVGPEAAHRRALAPVDDHLLEYASRASRTRGQPTSA